MALGASIAHVTLGSRLGRRALLVGAALGTLPDLDVVIPYADAIESFTYHRSWSHSLLVLSLLSPLLALLIQRVFRRYNITFFQCLASTWLILITHILLDSFTVYGTQLFWPLTLPPTAIGSVFIIDPLYTIPLITGIVLALRRPFHRSAKPVIACLVISTAYLGWTLVAQHQVQRKLEHTVTQLGLESEGLMVIPFPLSLLWRTVVQTEEHYYEGFSSLLDSNDIINLTQYDNGKQAYSQLLDEWPIQEWPIQRLDWFTRGMFSLNVEDDRLIASDLRIGVHGSYIFRFSIAHRNEADEWQDGLTEQLPVSVESERMKQLIQRVTKEDAIKY